MGVEVDPLLPYTFALGYAALLKCIFIDIC